MLRLNMDLISSDCKTKNECNHSIKVYVCKPHNSFFSKIQVDILRSVKPVEKDTFKPSLFLIFADHPELYRKKSQDDKMVLMEEVITFASKYI